MRKLLFAFCLLSLFQLGCNKESKLDEDGDIIGRWKLEYGIFKAYMNGNFIAEERMTLSPGEERILEITTQKINVIEIYGSFTEETPHNYEFVEGERNTIRVTNPELNESVIMRFSFKFGKLELVRSETPDEDDEDDDLGYDRVDIYEIYNRIQ